MNKFVAAVLARADFAIAGVIESDVPARKRMAAEKSGSAMGAIAGAAVNASKKPENYSAEQTASLVQRYAAGKGESVEALATAFGKTTKSIVAKLSREGVYQKKGFVSKVTGGDPVSKEQLVIDIAGVMGVAEDKLNGLDKATKPALMLLKAFLETGRDAVEELADIQAGVDSAVQFVADSELAGKVQVTAESSEVKASA